MYRPNPAPQNRISFLTCEVGTAHHPYDHCWKVCSVSAVLEAASPHRVGSYLRSPMREVYQLWCWKAAQLIVCLFACHAQVPGVQFLPLPELGMGMYACNPSTGDVAGRGSEVRGYPWLYIELAASLGSMRPCHKTNKQTKNPQLQKEAGQLWTMPPVSCQNSGSWRTQPSC